MDAANKTPQLRRQAVWVVGCRIVGILMTLAGNVLAARLLGPAEFGLYLFLSTVAAFGALLGSGGMGDATLRFCSECLAHGHAAAAAVYVRRIAQFALGTTILAAVVIALGLFGFQQATGRLTDPVPLVALTVLSLVALTWQFLAGETLRGWNDLKLASLFSGGFTGGPISNVLFVCGLIAYWLADWPLSTAGVVGLLAASICLSLPFALWSVWQKVLRPAARTAPQMHLTASENRRLLEMAGTVLVLHSLTFVGLQIDIWIGGALLPPEELGVYGAAKRCMLLTTIPVQMAMMTIAAAIPRLHTQDRQRDLQSLMRGSAGLAAVPSLAALALLVLLPGPVLHLLFGQSYNHADSLIRILALGNLVLILGGNPINLLTLTGRHRAALPVNVLSTLVIGIGGPWATLRYGASGLAWMSTSAIAVQHGLLWCLARRKLGIWTHVGWPSLNLGGDHKPAAAPAELVQPRDNRIDWNRQNLRVDRDIAISLSTELEKS